MITSPTSLVYIAAISLFGAPTWPLSRHTQTLDLGRDDLKQKKLEALYNVKTMVTLCMVLLYQVGSSIVSSIEFNRFGIVLRPHFIVLGFVMLLGVWKRRLSRWRQIKMLFVFMLISPNNFTNMGAMSLFCFSTWRHIRKLIRKTKVQNNPKTKRHIFTNNGANNSFSLVSLHWISFVILLFLGWLLLFSSFSCHPLFDTSFFRNVDHRVVFLCLHANKSH